MASETITYNVQIQFDQGFDTEDINLVEAFAEFKAQIKEQLTVHLPSTAGRMKAQLILVTES